MLQGCYFIVLCPIIHKCEIFKTFFIMEISEIKQRLKIETVLKHYGLQANRNGMLKCPFHEEKEPSLKICL